MKPLLFIVVMLYSAAITAQTHTETKEYYLNKSKLQKTTGYVLAGAGTALIIAGVIVGSNDDNDAQGEIDFGPNFDPGLWLVGGGLVCGAASIPLFISSANNARKAASIALGHQRIFIPQLNHPVARLQPAITLKITL